MINQVVRWLGALAVIGALSIDDIEQEGSNMSRIDWNAAAERAEWASYNARQDRTLAALSGLPPPPAPEPEFDTLEVATEITGPLADLFAAINRSVEELQAGGDRENRVAVQLLTAMARFEAEVTNE